MTKKTKHLFFRLWLLLGLFMLFLPALGLFGQSRPLMMPAYPGSVEVMHPSWESTSEFLTRDTLETVAAFYRRQPGMPAPEESSYGSRGMRFTLAEDAKPIVIDDPKMGVFIKEAPDERAGVFILRQDDCDHAEAVFRDLDALVRSEEISARDVQHLRARFSRLGGFSRTIGRQERGEHLTETAAVYERYRKDHDRLMEELKEARRSRERETEAAREQREEDTTELVAEQEKMMELMMQGRFLEAAAIGEEMTRKAELVRGGRGASGRSGTPAQEEVRKKSAQILALWDKGLEEMASHRYPVKIFIRHGR